METALADHSEGSKDSASASAPAVMRLKFPIALIVIFWLVYFALDLTEIIMFHRFLIRLGAMLLTGLVVLIWWLRQSSLTLTARLGVVAAFVGVSVVSVLLLDKTILPVIPIIWAVPLFISLGLIFLRLRPLTTGTIILGFAGIAVLSWLPGLVQRAQGMNGDGSNEFYWRWTTSTEQKFLSSLTPAPASLQQSENAGPLVAGPADWTCFRGPSGNSKIELPGLITDWKASPPTLKWKREVGPAWSSMIIVGDHLFTQEQRGQEECTTCYSAIDGSPEWVHAVTDRFEEALGGVGPRATPTFAEGFLYVYSPRGRLECLNAVTGKVQWTRNVFEEQNVKTLPMWGYSISPVVVDHDVIVFAGGQEQQRLVSYDALTGEPRWTAAAGKESYSSPVHLVVDGVSQVLYLSDTQLISVDPATGKELWSFKNPATSGGRPTCQPQLVGEHDLLVSFAPDHLIRIEIKKSDDAWDARQAWLSSDLKPDFSDYLFHDGQIYGFDQTLFASIDFVSGERNWKKGRYGAGQAILVEPAGAIVVVTEQGELVLLQATPDKSVELAKMPAVTGKTWNHLAMAGNRLYVRSSEQMACFELPRSEAKSPANESP